MVSLPPPVAHVNDRDHYNAKPHVFYGDIFDYWKDRIESFFLGHGVDLWDMVVYGYIHPVYASGNKVQRRVMTEQQKKYYKNHKARTILLNAISYAEYEKITNRDTTKSIFDSLRMTHEGNTHVKEAKTLALIHKYKAFKMEDERIVENILSRFQTLVARLKVLDKEYSTADYVKKIIRSQPKRWRHLVTALNLSNNLNNTSLKELVSSLRSHEIELKKDELKRKRKCVALNSLGKSEKTKAL